MHAFNDVTDGPDALEFFRIQLAARKPLQLYDQVDSVDAVEIEILDQTRVHRDLFGRNLEHLFEISHKLLVDIVARQHCYFTCCCDRMNCARLRTFMKCCLTSSVTDSILRP